MKTLLKKSGHNGSSPIFYELIWIIFSKNKILLTAILLSCILAAILISLLFPRYTSEAMLIVRPNFDPTKFSFSNFDISTNESFLSTQLSLLSSRLILSETLIAFYNKPTVTEKQIEKLNSSLYLKHHPLNNLVTVKLKWDKEDEVTSLLTNLLETYTEWVENNALNDASRVHDILHELMLSQQNDLEGAEKNLDKFLEANRDTTYNFPELHSQIINQISETNEQLKYKQNELSKLNTIETELLKIIEDSKVQDLFSSIEKAVLEKSKIELSTTQTKILELKRPKNPNNTQIIEHEFSLSSLRNQVLNTADKTISAEKALLEPEIQETLKKLVEVKIDKVLTSSAVSFFEQLNARLEIDLNRLNHTKTMKRRFERNVSVFEAWYFNLQHKIQENKIYLKKKSSIIKIILPPTRAIQTNTPLRMSLYGLLSGTLACLMLLYFLTFGSKYVNTPYKISRLSEKPILSIIPAVPPADYEPPLYLKAKSNNFRKSFDNLAALIMLNYSAPLSLHVTGTSNRAGKTTVAINLAIAMAQGNMKVLLVDCDDKRHSSYNLLHTDSKKSNHCKNNFDGISDLVNSSIPNLKVCKLQNHLQNSLDIQANIATGKNLTNELANFFSLVIFDSLSLMDKALYIMLCKVTTATLVVTCPAEELRDRIVRVCKLMDSLKVEFPGWVINNKY